MGLFDRLTSTLDGLGRGDEAERVAGEEIDLALAFADRGDLAEAERRLRAVSEKLPHLARVFASLGDVLARRGAYDEPARDALRRALTRALDPAERGRAHAALGRLYAAHGALGKALRELGKAVQLQPGDAALAADYGRV